MRHGALWPYLQGQPALCPAGHLCPLSNMGTPSANLNTQSWCRRAAIALSAWVGWAATGPAGAARPAPFKAWRRGCSSGLAAAATARVLPRHAAHRRTAAAPPRSPTAAAAAAPPTVGHVSGVLPILHLLFESEKASALPEKDGSQQPQPTADGTARAVFDAPIEARETVRLHCRASADHCARQLSPASPPIGSATDFFVLTWFDLLCHRPPAARAGTNGGGRRQGVCGAAAGPRLRAEALRHGGVRGCTGGGGRGRRGRRARCRAVRADRKASEVWVLPFIFCGIFPADMPAVRARGPPPAVRANRQAPEVLPPAL